jgi:signal peptidase I
VRRPELTLGAAFVVLGTVASAAAFRGRYVRVAVSGHSMEPTLLDGDWLLVDRRVAPPRAGQIVVADDPRSRGRLIVKRVSSVAADGVVALTGDHPAHVEDVIAPVTPVAVVGRPILRYWPLRRFGRVHVPPRKQS